MSRTIPSPIRRSKRLLENGYYRIESAEAFDLMDVSASDEDDAASVDSNLSKLSHNSEQRRVVYKESPVLKQRLFNYRKKHQPRSPIHYISTNNLNTTGQNLIEHTSQKTKANRIFSTRNTSLHKDFALQQLSQSNDFYVEKEKMLLSNQQSLPEQNANIANLYRESGIGDNKFKLPVHVKHGDVMKSNTKIQDKSADYLINDEDFENNKSNTGNFCKSWMQQLFDFSLKVILILSSFVLNYLLKGGRRLYQVIIRVIVFDAWVLSSTVQIKAFSEKLIKMISILFILLFSMLLLYTLLQLPKSYKKIQTDGIHSISTVFNDTNNTVNNHSLPDFSYVDIQASLQNLEMSLKEVETTVLEKHATVLNTMKKIQKSNELQGHSITISQEELLFKIEEMITKSVAEEVDKNNRIVQKKFESVQVELALLQKNHSHNVEILQKIIKNVDESKKTSEPFFLRLASMGKQLMDMEIKVVTLLKDHNALKTFINHQAGNLTFLRQVSNQQFISNFQTLFEEELHSPTLQQTTKLRRQSHLMEIFMSWIERKGYIKQDALNKMREEVSTNSTRIESYFQDALLNTVNELKYSNLDALVHAHTINISSNEVKSSEITEGLIKQWIKEALEIYSADRIGEADFALESAGGSIVNTRCSETYRHKTALVSVLGIPLYYNINTPRSLIQPSVMPGECWAFVGSKGFVVISLSTEVKPTAITIDHIPRSLSFSNSISSAPKDFSVYGLADASDLNGLHLGSFRYDKEGDPIQRFPLEKTIDKRFGYIELRITSNWGNADFTCLYRFRVHGAKD